MQNEKLKLETFLFVLIKKNYLCALSESFSWGLEYLGKVFIIALKGAYLNEFLLGNNIK